MVESSPLATALFLICIQLSLNPARSFQICIQHDFWLGRKPATAIYSTGLLSHGSRQGLHTTCLRGRQNQAHGICMQANSGEAIIVRFQPGDIEIVRQIGELGYTLITGKVL